MRRVHQTDTAEKQQDGLATMTAYHSVVNTGKLNAACVVQTRFERLEFFRHRGNKQGYG